MTRHLRPLLALALLAAGAAACGQNEAVALVEAMARDVCRCADLDCAIQVEEQYYPKLKAIESSARGTEADKKAIEAAGRRLRECRAKLEPATPAP